MLFIIVNSIRLAVVARAEEIEVMRLVGACDAFIRWPFVFEGAFIGLLGALATLAVLARGRSAVQAMVGFFEVLPLELGSLARDTAILVLASGLGLGVLGSWVSVRTYLSAEISAKGHQVPAPFAAQVRWRPRASSSARHPDPMSATPRDAEEPTAEDPVATRAGRDG